MAHTRVLEADEVSTVAHAASPLASRPAVDFSHVPDLSNYLLVDPPKRHRKFRSWFALAVFAGVLMALVIVAILNS